MKRFVSSTFAGRMDASVMFLRNLPEDALLSRPIRRILQKEAAMTKTAPDASAAEPGSPGHRFTFGLWTVGNPGRDPFGGPTRAEVDPVDSVYKLGALGG